MAKRALIVLAEGFEEIEAITPIDILKRAGVDVTIAGVASDVITAAHGVSFKTDVIFEDTKEDFDAVILPGGMPGAENLRKATNLKGLVMHMASEGKLVASICASPALVLAPWGVLNGKEATCFPGYEKSFTPEVTFKADDVVSDGNVITSRGAGTAFAFALKIVEHLVGKSQADMIAEQTVYKQV